MSKKGIILVFSTALISGVSVFVNKYAVSFGNPFVFTFLKNVSVALILSALFFSWKLYPDFKKIETKNWLKLIMIGLIGGSIPFLLFFKGLSSTSAAEGSFIQKTMFVYVAVLAVIFLKEKINKGFIIGALFLLIGNLLALKSFDFNFGKGDLLILVATIFWAVENVISKKVLENMKSEIVAWGRMFFGSIFIFAYVLISNQVVLISKIDLHQIGWIAVTSAFLFGYVLTWYKGLKEIPVSLATSILLLGSPMTLILNLMSGGKISWQEIISGILILIGLVFIAAVDYFWKKQTLGRKIYGRA